MIAIVFLLIVIIILVARSVTRNPSYKGKAGEIQVSDVLERLPQEYLIINNIIIPDQKINSSKNYTTQIDHLVVSPFGIFVIETKNYGGWIFGSEHAKRWKQTFKTTPGHYFYNPIKQNWGHAYALAELLQLDINLFKPIIVFSDDCELSVEATIPVVYMSELLKAIQSNTLEVLSSHRVAEIYNRLNRINLKTAEIENEHIQSIEERKTTKEAALQEGRCPRCGGKLKLRSGKYGAFYGCTNYPKCKFTKN